MDIWDGKIRKLDSKIITVEELAEKMNNESTQMERNLRELVHNL